MKTTDEIMELAVAWRDACLLEAREPGAVQRGFAISKGRELRAAIDGTKHEYRDYIAVNLPAADYPIDSGVVVATTGEILGVNMTLLRGLELQAQAEAKLRYIRADAMLAARGGV